jgi:pimeloyl-ACP methyl ester carboxylesterase
VAPDLPGTGDSGHPPGGFSADAMVEWLHELVRRTCHQPPVLVGHAVGGALAARYALRHGNDLAALVLVDTLGLRRFVPSPNFGFRLVRFLSNPTEASYEPFFQTCMYDGGATKKGLGDRWNPFLADYLAGIQDTKRKDAVGELIKHLGGTRIEGLEQIAVPTTLIWGRHDRATPLRAARAASRRYAWPLHVIDACGDDPKLERPEAFLEALDAALRRAT